jgi:hypothetical protein
VFNPLFTTLVLARELFVGIPGVFEVLFEHFVSFIFFEEED